MLSDFQISTDRKWTNRATCLQTYGTLQVKASRASVGPRVKYRTVEDYFQALKANGNLLLVFKLAWNW